MFSMSQKKEIAKKVEEILLSYNHPEMLKEKPDFTLHIRGAEDWSWADISPNWVFEDGHRVVKRNPFNERAEIDKGVGDEI